MLFIKAFCLTVILLVDITSSNPFTSNQDEELDPLLARTLVTTDFESGMGPWFDFSNGDVNWSVESITSPAEPLPAPQPNSGSRYLRAKRREQGSSGTAVLRSPVFTVYPGDKLTFDFWIRSRHLQTNNLEVYWVNGTREERILSLAEYSSPANFEWRTVSVAIPSPRTTDTRIVFYGYCGYNEEDAIAIDNIEVGSLADDTTTQPTTTSVPCPSNLGSSTNPCSRTTTGCYCVYHELPSMWITAADTCRSYDMKLVSIETREEQESIAAFMKTLPGLSDFYFTSARRAVGDDQWYWNATGVPLNAGFTNWDPSEPNGSGSCLYIFGLYNFTWGDALCTTDNYFICEQ